MPEYLECHKEHKYIWYDNNEGWGELRIFKQSPQRVIAENSPRKVNVRSHHPVKGLQMKSHICGVWKSSNIVNTVFCIYIICRQWETVWSTQAHWLLCVSSSSSPDYIYKDRSLRYMCIDMNVFIRELQQASLHIQLAESGFQKTHTDCR